MTGLRHSSSRHRALRSRPWLAALILAAALLLRVLVPAGFMPTFADGRMTLAICDGSGVAAFAATTHGMHHAPTHEMAESGCAFADLSVPALGSAPPALLAAALAYVLALALTRRVPIARWPAERLRPPPRAPPAIV